MGPVTILNKVWPRSLFCCCVMPACHTPQLHVATAKQPDATLLCNAECLVMPHLAQLVIAAVFAVIYIAAGGLFALADVTPNPVSKNWLATAHSTVEVKAWALRTLIVLCASLLSGFYKVQTTPILIFAAWLAYVHIRWVSSMG